VNARLIPSEGSAGTRVRLEVEASAAAVRVNVPGVYYGAPLTRDASGKFVLETTVPYGGMPGVYPVQVQALDDQGRTVEETELRFTLL
jgi:hypothetical protein